MAAKWAAEPDRRRRQVKERTAEPGQHGSCARKRFPEIGGRRERRHFGPRSTQFAHEMGIRAGTHPKPPSLGGLCGPSIPAWQECPGITNFHYVRHFQTPAGVPRRQHGVGKWMRSVYQTILIADPLYDLGQRQALRYAPSEKQADDLRPAAAADFFANDDE
jgi:hypothetical protein